MGELFLNEEFAECAEILMTKIAFEQTSDQESFSRIAFMTASDLELTWSFA